MVHPVVLILIGITLIILGTVFAVSSLANIEWGLCVVIGVVPICGASSKDAAVFLAIASTMLGLVALVTSYMLSKAFQRTN